MQTLKINFQEGDLPSLHPHELMIYLRGLSIAKTLYEGLTRIDAEGKPQLAGASSFEVSPDGLHYIFVLRDNKWSDGTPVTAFQYENAWKEALSPVSSCPRSDLLYMVFNAKEAKKGSVSLDAVGVKALDAKTLSVDLSYPSPYFLELLAQPICAPLIDPRQKEPTAFNGPFIVADWQRDDALRLEPNPYFWNRDEITLNEIDVFMIQDTMSAFNMFEKGELDWIGVPLCPLSSELVSHIKKTGNLRSHPIDRAFWVFLNTQHPSLASPLIRQALSLSIDRKAITSHILSSGNPLKKPMPIGLLPLPTPSPLKEDLSEAKIHFDQGLKELGFTRETLPALVISYSQQANRKQLAEYLQQTWTKAFGIQVQLKAEEWTVLRSNLGKGLFEISGCFEAAFYNDPLELLERFTSLNPCNFSQWVTPEFGEKISLATQEKEPAERMKLLAEAEQILMEQVPFIPISSDELLFAHHPDLSGYAFDYVGAIDFSRASFKAKR